MHWEITLHTEKGLSAKTKLVSQETIEAYCETGIAAYLDHYTHLWEQGNPTPYFNQYYRPENVKEDLEKGNFIHGLLEISGEYIGIFKLDLERNHPGFYPGETLFVEKLYLKKSVTGSGLGSTLIRQYSSWAIALNRKAIWLETMYKGPARNFYLQKGFRYLGDTEVPYPEVLESERAMWEMGLDL